MWVAVSEQTLRAPFTTDTALLVTTKDGLRSGLLPTVDEDTSSFESHSDPLSGLNITTPDACAEAGSCSICTCNHFFLVGPWLGWNNGAWDSCQ